MLDARPQHTPLTVAVIGAGMVAHDHCRAFDSLYPSARIVAVADVDEQRASALAASYGARAFTDYRAALADGPDIAVVCLPHHLHREAGIAAAAAGCHVLMEKPLAHTLEDAHDIVASCRQHKVLLAVGFVHRYRQEMQQASRLIAAGEIGSPSTGLDNFHTQGGSQLPGWVWDRNQAGGGVLMYTGIHSIDRLRWLVGAEVAEVYARSATYSRRADVEDGLVATLIFTNGCIATLFENSPSYRLEPRTWDVELYGSRGRLRIRTREYVELSTDAGVQHFDSGNDDPFAAQAGDLVAAVRERRAPWIGGDDGIRSLAVAHAIYRSAAARRAVLLNEVLE